MTCRRDGCDLEARPDRLMCQMHFTHEPPAKTPDPMPSCPVHGADLEPERCWTCEKAKGARVACLACGRPLPSPPSLCASCMRGKGQAEGVIETEEEARRRAVAQREVNQGRADQSRVGTLIKPKPERATHGREKARARVTQLDARLSKEGTR